VGCGVGILTARLNGISERAFASNADVIERVLHLPFLNHPSRVLATSVAVLSLLLPLLFMNQLSPLRWIFLTHLAAQIAVTELGNFPVPVIGAGASPILGWYIMAGLLMAQVKTITAGP
jgi:hypothetical protein